MKNNIRIGNTLFLFSSLFETGGIQRYNKHLCDAFLSEFPKHSFTAVLLDPIAAKKIDRWENIHIKFIRNIPGNFFKKIIYAFHVLFLVIVNRPIFLVCAHPGLCPIAFFMKKIFGIKYAVLTHGTDVWYMKKGIKLKGLENADLIITVSRYTKEKIMSYGIDDNKIKVIPDTVDLSLFCPKPINEKMAEQFQPDKKTILFTSGRISSLERYKGHDILLDVMKALDENYIWIVAGDGDDRNRLMGKTKEYGLTGRVHFVGRVDIKNLIDYYNLCNLFIMPSTGEGFGIVFLEAMACGKPVIGGKYDGTREPLMDGSLGYMVDPGNVEEIARTVINVVGANNELPLQKDKRNDPSYLREQVKENFGIEAFKKNITNTFKEYI